MGRLEPTDPVLEALHQLHRSGWSIGDAVFRGGAGECVGIVSGSHGENLLRAEGATSVEARDRAVEQARGLGLLRRSR
jgi:hypothetical protein